MSEDLGFLSDIAMFMEGKLIGISTIGLIYCATVIAALSKRITLTQYL